MSQLKLVVLECDGPDGEGCPERAQLHTTYENVVDARVEAELYYDWKEAGWDHDLCESCAPKLKEQQDE